MQHSFHGDRLRLARQIAGLTLEQVAQHIGTTRQFIHQLETGSRTPSDEAIGALVGLLSVRREFFRTPLMNPVRVDHVHFRRIRSLPTSVTQETLSYATLFEALVAALEVSVDFPNVIFPELSVDSPASIEEAAERTRLTLGLDLISPIPNVTRALENAGAVVAEFDGISDKVDACSIARARPIIVRNTFKESRFRQRYDLAHECAHLVIHQGMVTGDSISERQANQFAGAFLIPKAAFLKEFRRSNRLDWVHIFDLKVRWGVSAQAIVMRAYELMCIDDSGLKRAFIHLSNTGQRSRENLDDNFELERPEAIANAVELIISSKQKTFTDLAKDVGVSRELLSRLLSFTGYRPPGEEVEVTGRVLQFARQQRPS